MLVGHSPKLCTSNYHRGWPIQNQTNILTKSFTAMSALHPYPVVLAGLYSDRHQNQCSKTVFMGGCCKLLWKWQLLFVTWTTGVSRMWHNMYLYAGSSGRKQSWSETCNIDVFSRWRENFALQKPKILKYSAISNSCTIVLLHFFSNTLQTHLISTVHEYTRCYTFTSDHTLLCAVHLQQN